MAIRTFNSVAGFSVGESPTVVITSTGNVTSNNVLTDHLLHSNGAPWAFSTAAGANNYIQYGEANTLAASANLTYDDSVQVLTVAGNANIQVDLIVPNITTPSGNLNIAPASGGVVNIANTAGGATGIALGDPTLGNLVSNAVALSNSTSVTNSIAELNAILGKLVPPSPSNFPASQNFSVQSLSSYRMANFTQTDNTATQGHSVAGGNTVSTVLRTSVYSTNTIANAGPGNSGTVQLNLNGVAAGNVTLTNSLNGNGTHGNLVITNNVDYHTVNANIQVGFWSVFSASATGSVTQGWNEAYISDSAAGNTNTVLWYYDGSNPGTPSFSTTSITPPNSPSYTYSSTVPHYNSSNQFTISFNVNKLSGDMYPLSDTFVTGTAGGAFQTPSSVTYSAAGVTTPLVRNLYVSSGSQAVSTTANIATGFGSSASGPSVSVTNSYNSASQTFNPSATVLYKTGTSNALEETSITIGSTIGSGSGNGYRILNPGSTDTPAYTGSETAFNSQTSTLQTYDATIVGGILKNDVTNYSTYLPVGPDLSGQGSTQYFTFKFIRASTSKFDIQWTGTLAGLWVALPGSAIDTSSTLNGWLTLGTAYAGAGQPGAGSGGNGSNGAALGGTTPLNSAQTNKRITATFGTVSSSSTSNNEIYVRIKLTTGQSITALSLQTASN